MSTSHVSPEAEALRKDAGRATALGVIVLFVGVFAILSPLIVGVSTVLLVGASLLVHGFLQMVHAATSKSLVMALGGLFSIACGVLAILHPLAGLAFLTLLLAAFFFIKGGMRAGLSLQLRPAKGWGWMLFDGLVSILLGVLLWTQWPLSGAWAVGTLVGIHIIFVGWSMIAVGSVARAASAEAA